MARRKNLSAYYESIAKLEELGSRKMVRRTPSRPEPPKVNGRAEISRAANNYYGADRIANTIQKTLPQKAAANVPIPNHTPGNYGPQIKPSSRAAFAQGTADVVQGVGSAASWRGFDKTAARLKEVGSQMSGNIQPIPYAEWDHGKGLLNPNYYKYNIPRMAAFPLAFTAASIPMALGGEALAGAAGLGAAGSTIAGGVTAGLGGRALEGAVEAGQFYDETGDREKANSIWLKNQALAATDAYEYLAMFAPGLGPLAKAGKYAKMAGAVGKFGASAAMEGFEENYQNAVQNQAHGDKRGLINMTVNPDSWEEFAGGAMLGGLMTGPGAASEIAKVAKIPSKSKWQQAINQLEGVNKAFAQGNKKGLVMEKVKAPAPVAKTQEDIEIEAVTKKARTVKPGKGKYITDDYIGKNAKAPEVEAPKVEKAPIPKSDFANGDIVVDKTGRKWTVSDVSDPSQLKVKSETGTETMVGRKAVSKEAPVVNNVKQVEPLTQDEVKAPIADVAPIENVKQVEPAKVETPIIPAEGKTEPIVEPKATPDRMRNLFRGKNGMVRVEFPDAAHAELFDFSSKIRKSIESNRPLADGEIDNITTRLSKQIGIPKEKVFAYAGRYNNEVKEASKGVAVGTIHKAHKWVEKQEEAKAKEPVKPAEPKAKEETTTDNDMEGIKAAILKDKNMGNARNAFKNISSKEMFLEVITKKLHEIAGNHMASDPALEERMPLWNSLFANGGPFEEMAQDLYNKFEAEFYSDKAEHENKKSKEVSEDAGRIEIPSNELRIDGTNPLEGTQAENVPGTTDEGATKESPVRSPRTDKRPDATNQGSTKRNPSKTNDRKPDGANEVRADDSEHSLGDGEGGIHTPADRERPAKAGNEPRNMGSTAGNYRITDEDNLGKGSIKQKYKGNISAIKLLKELQAEGRMATPEEQKILVKYVGWGGMPQVFYTDYRRNPHQDWVKEYSELKELLTEEEYSNAKGSTLNAHYTSPAIISHMYKALEKLGFESGRILEPSMGIGHFFGLMPAKMAAKSKMVGIELDSLTGQIAKQLYQNADIRIQGFEKAKLADNFFDVAISNVPFGGYTVNDTKFNKYKLKIHNYFFIKALDKVRPGGLLVFITSTGTMDSSKLPRSLMSDQADFIGAIRLPGDAFKENANTEVTTDLIILQKREPGVAKNNIAWQESDFTELKSSGYPYKPLSINEYFVNNPDMVLGELVEDKLHQGRLGVKASGNFMDKLNDAIEKLPTNIFKKPVNKATEQQQPNQFIPEPGELKENGYKVEKGVLWQLKDGEMVKVPEVKGATLTRIEGMLEIRDKLREVLRAQLEDAPDSVLSKNQKELNRVYDAFIKKHRNQKGELGYLNNPTNARAFLEDPDSPLLLSIEKWDRKTKTATKEAIFSKRTISPPKPIEKVETSKEALIVSLNEKGRVDIDFMAKLSGLTTDTIIGELRGVIYQDPGSELWEAADAYLSGNVRQKLADAESAALTDPKYSENVEALKAVQPKDLEPHLISAKPGAIWIPITDMSDFIGHMINEKSQVTVQYSSLLGEYSVKEKGSLRQNVANMRTWGAGGLSFVELLDDALNLRMPTISYKTIEGKTVHDEKATIAARDMLQQIKDEFKKWIWTDMDRAERLARKYNDEFNNIKTREYDGSHLTLPGMANDITLLDHQKDVIWRMMQGNNTLLAHAVGAGKTYAMIGAGMELKRIGLIKKPLYVVPNHLLEQWATDFYKMYPAAKVLYVSSSKFPGVGVQKRKDQDEATREIKKLEKQQKRKILLNKIVMGDWDAIIITHSSFMKIPMSPEYANEHIQNQLNDMEQAILAAQQEGENARIIKRLETRKKNLEAKLIGQFDETKKDIVIPFEELGIDQIFVDEAHMFKNLFFATKMNNISGLSTADSDRSNDMFLKTQWLTQQNKGGGVVFATGTPISNNIGEMFTMQRYLGMADLRNRNLAHFDSWAATFTEQMAGEELDATGKYKQKTRLAEFSNMPELMKMFKAFADIKTKEMLNLPVPSLAGGEKHTIVAPASDALKSYVQRLDARMDAIRSGRVNPKDDNALKVTGDGRKASLDIRLVMPHEKEDANSKIIMCVKNVHRIWEKTAENRSAQLVFLDMSTPKKKEAKKEEEGIEEAEEQENVIVYHDIRRKLKNMGIPEKEIAFIHDANTDAKKLDLFESVRRGDVRVLIGSTEKMGAGMNAQDKLIALHHLDAPWRPSDIEQREGRIIRRGNENKEVSIFNYVTEESFDAVMWQTLEFKARFVNQVMNGDESVRNVENLEDFVVGFATVKALASGNPLILEKVKIDNEVKKLEALRISHEDKKWAARRRIQYIPKKLIEVEEAKAKWEKDLKQRQDTRGDKFKIVIGKKTFDKRKDAGEKIIELVKKSHGTLKKEQIGSFAGFNLFLHTFEELWMEPKILLDGAANNYEIGFSPKEADPVGILVAMENALGRIEKRIELEKDDFEGLSKELEDLKNMGEKPFEYEEKLKEITQKQTDINTQIAESKKTPTVASVETEAGERVNDTIPEGRPNIGGTIQMVGATAEEAFNGEFKFEDPEVEARMSAAEKGFKPESLLNKVRLAIQTFKNKWTREFEHLPRGAFWSKARFALNTLLKGDAIASRKALDLLQAVIVKLKKNEFKAFSRKVVLENTAENYRMYLEEVDGQENPEPFIFPYGFEDEVQFRKELSRLNDYLEKAKRKDKDGNLVSFALDAYNFRQRMMKGVTKDLIEAAKDIGVNKEKIYNRENYFRQQVLELMKEEGVITGTGSKVKTQFRGHEQKRDIYGTEHDYSANYLQAEYEVMSKMLFDIQLFKTIKVMKDYDVMESLKLQALKENDAKILDYFRDLLSNPEVAEIAGTDDAEKFYRIVLNTKQARGFSALFALAADGELPEGPNGKFEELIEEMAKAYLLKREDQSNADEVADGIHVQASLPKEYYKQLFSYLNYILKEHGGSEESGAAALIYRGMAEKKSTIKNTLGRKFKTWKNLIPKGYTDWTPNPGTSFYTAYSLSEKKAQELFEDAMQQVGVSKSDLRKVHVAGQKKVMVIPQELADTLNNLVEVKSRGLLAKGMVGWKVWQLLMPKRLIKYNVRNFPGDLEKSLHNPKSLLKAPKAAWDLAQVFFRNRAIPPEMKPFVERGGFEAGLYIQDLGDINRVKAFLHVMEEKSLWQKTYNFPVNAVKGYWFHVKNFTSWREAVLRYANFLEYVEQIEASKKGKPKNFGASVPEEVMALGDKYDMAYKLSNDLIGAYDATSVYGQEIREKAIPFFSFQEANMKSFVQLMKNASRDDKLARTVGIKLMGTAVLRSPFWVIRMGRFAIKAAGLFIVLQIYNNHYFPDEEKDLPPEVQAKPHIIFGRNPDGTIDYFDRLGVLGDFLEWFGLDETPKDYNDYINGRRTLKEILLDMMKSPVNKVVNSSFPIIKTAGELLTGKSLYPDISKPRTIHDKAEHATRSMELDEEYKAMTGKPGVPYWSRQNFIKWVGYETDPKLNAYYSIMDEKYRYMKKIGKGNGESTGKKTEAMRNYKLALRYNDQKAAEKYLTEYFLAGGTERGYNQSLESAHPLSFLNEEERATFTDSLSVDDLGKLAKAIELYEEVWMPAD